MIKGVYKNVETDLDKKLLKKLNFRLQLRSSSE